ncbi:MAG: TonB-dependent receptor plug domain-containing protein, partial [Flavobacteriales bacterium]|nr:TonB-dependent receptor plug domain-containing protein [Flavobacteriales bacterium]
MRVFFFLLCCSFGISLNAQQSVRGQVTDADGGIPFAHVVAQSGEMSVCDEEGKFVLQIPDGSTIKLAVSAMGYVTFQGTFDTSEFIRVSLEKVMFALDEVVVTGTMREMSILQSPVKTEVATAALLEAIPSYSVIESISMVNGVQEVVSCGVCGTNDIHINGMEGAYTLVLIDGMPIMSSLASVYGFNGIPTSLIKQVEIVKGPSSTLYGTEAVGGVINIITKKPQDISRLAFGASYSTHDEFNADILAAPQLGDKINFLISGNLFRNEKRLDDNGDNFTDIPLSERYSIFSKLSFDRPQDRKASIAFRYYDEERWGGVM